MACHSSFSLIFFLVGGEEGGVGGFVEARYGHRERGIADYLTKMIQSGPSELSLLHGAFEEGARVCDGVCEGSEAWVDGFRVQGEGF